MRKDVVSISRPRLTRRRTALQQLPINRSRLKSGEVLETVRILTEHGDADPMLLNSYNQSACEVFQDFFRWPSRPILRNDMAATFKWLLKSAPLESHLVPTAAGRSHNFTLFGGLNIDEEAESLDTFLNHKPDAETAISKTFCPGSFDRGWTPLHVLLHLRIEPVWHPWSESVIVQQTSLWGEAIHCLMTDGQDPHARDKAGETPTMLALRSLYSFHLRQNAVTRQGYDLLTFAREELDAATSLAHEGWKADSLQNLFEFPTEKFYHLGPRWRESNEHREFHNGDGADGLYTRCCWFHLLDVLRTRMTLPRGWQLLTLPRNFNTSRTGVSWNQAESSMSFARPAGGNNIDMSASRAACRQGRDLVAELARLGVDWS